MHIAMLLAATVLSAPVYAAAVPELVPGVWTNISPAGVNFHAGNVDPVFTQGVAVDPNDPNILYLCVCSYKAELGGLYKEKTWTGHKHLSIPSPTKDFPPCPSPVSA